MVSIGDAIIPDGLDVAMLTDEGGANLLLLPLQINLSHSDLVAIFPLPSSAEIIPFSDSLSFVDDRLKPLISSEKKGIGILQH